MHHLENGRMSLNRPADDRAETLHRHSSRTGAADWAGPDEVRLESVELPGLPQRMRGESFHQEPRRSYSFDGCFLAANLYALHTERAILVQFDVSGSAIAARGEPPLSAERLQLARQIMGGLRAEFEGFRPALERLVLRQTSPVELEGPYIAAGQSALSLLMRVSRGANYDQVYEQVERLLDRHPRHDDRGSGTVPAGERPYRWTEEELDYAEHLPPEELLNLKDRAGQPIPPEAFMAPRAKPPVESDPDPWQTRAALSAGRALRSFFRSDPRE